MLSWVAKELACGESPDAEQPNTTRIGLRGQGLNDPAYAEYFLKKEVIQPLGPQRLPCYDFIPVAEPAFGACPLAVGTATSGEVSSHDVTGGVYKARERIQGAVADAPLLAIPTSCSRVAGCNPNWGRLSGFAAPRGGAALCTGHCSTFAALGVRAIRT